MIGMLIGVIVVLALLIVYVINKKVKERTHQKQKRQLFREKFGVDAPQDVKLSIEKEKTFTNWYDLGTTYKKNKDEMEWKPSFIKMGRFLIEFCDPYQAVRYIRYLYDEGVPLVKKGESSPSLPTLENLPNI